MQSFSFSVGYENVAIYLSLGLLVVGLFLPIYRAECIFGYVFGSIIFTGAIIPLIGILIIGAISLFAHACIKPFALRFIKVVRAQPQWFSVTIKLERKRNNWLRFASLHNFSQPLLSLLFGCYDSPQLALSRTSAKSEKQTVSLCLCGRLFQLIYNDSNWLM